MKIGDRVMMAGEVVEMDMLGDEVTHVRVQGQNDAYWIRVENLFPLPDRPILCDPTSLEAQALLGQEVEFADDWTFGESRRDVLSRLGTGVAHPFYTDRARWRFIRALPAPKVLTRADAEAKLAELLGENVRIEG